MDPYLESPELWQDVHATLMTVLREQLVPKLRPRYFVGIDDGFICSRKAIRVDP
jgi:hypothetical protein